MKVELLFRKDNLDATAYWFLNRERFPKNTKRDFESIKAYFFKRAEDHLQEQKESYWNGDSSLLKDVWLVFKGVNASLTPIPSNFIDEYGKYESICVDIPNLNRSNKMRIEVTFLAHLP